MPWPSVSSIGWRTDLSLRQLEGAEITRRQDHLIVRTTENPTYRWGNFLLFDSPPRGGDAERWLALFEAAFPEADYVAIGIDSPSGAIGETAELSAGGMTVGVETVMTATALRMPTHTPTREPPQAVFRRVDSEEDWRQALSLRLAVDEHGHEPGFGEFMERQMAAIRRVCEDGHGGWFGAFCDDQMRASLGIFDAGSGLARFQSVDTHPEHRRRGLASNLLVAAGEYALTELAASTLVIAADPDYFAIDIYRSLGFEGDEHHVQLERLGS